MRGLTHKNKALRKKRETPEKEKYPVLPPAMRPAKASWKLKHPGT
ncbi:hypothetical protein LptCag_0736 [Leptospirillum ferriphilum]|jgi:hypothetical protein|uniref:Uncharacterized protein n=1 Tax=Leptospirillum ferriphilum TaxID=178606 RepID=A0A094WCB3_9BACT|nr:hypothetical protein LptCag_0736 [Leptospirillum ferriphilum]